MKVVIMPCCDEEHQGEKTSQYDEMEKYTAVHGFHFSEGMAKWAVSLMVGRDGKEIKFTEPSVIKEHLTTEKMPAISAEDYDIAYVYAMGKADYWGSCITTEKQLLQFVEDYFNDEDGYKDKAFVRFCADCRSKNIKIVWN